MYAGCMWLMSVNFSKPTEGEEEEKARLNNGLLIGFGSCCVLTAVFSFVASVGHFCFHGIGDPRQLSRV